MALGDPFNFLTKSCSNHQWMGKILSSIGNPVTCILNKSWIRNGINEMSFAKNLCLFSRGNILGRNYKSRILAMRCSTADFKITFLPNRNPKIRTNILPNTHCFRYY